MLLDQTNLGLLILAERIRKLDFLHWSYLKLCQVSKVTCTILLTLRWKVGQMDSQRAFNHKKYFIYLSFYIFKLILSESQKKIHTSRFSNLLFFFYITDSNKSVIYFLFHRLHLVHNVLWLEVKVLEGLSFEKYWCTLFLPPPSSSSFKQQQQKNLSEVQ